MLPSRRIGVRTEDSTGAYGFEAWPSVDADDTVEDGGGGDCCCCDGADDEDDDEEAGGADAAEPEPAPSPALLAPPRVAVVDMGASGCCSDAGERSSGANAESA